MLKDMWRLAGQRLLLGQGDTAGGTASPSSLCHGQHATAAATRSSASPSLAGRAAQPQLTCQQPNPQPGRAALTGRSSERAICRRGEVPLPGEQGEPTARCAHCGSTHLGGLNVLSYSDHTLHSNWVPQPLVAH